MALIAIGSQLTLRAALTEELHKTYPLDADGRVSLNNVHGAAHITAWDRNEVQVDASTIKVICTTRTAGGSCRSSSIARRGR